MALFRSPIFLSCLFLFIAHQLFQKVLNISLPLFDDYLDNLVAMPIILTIFLTEKRMLWGKGNNYKLPVLDIVLLTIYLSFISELVFPFLSNRFTADWLDVGCYVLGSYLFYKCMNR